MILSAFTSTLVADDGALRYFAIASAGSITSLEIPASIYYRSPRIITAQPLTIDLVLDVLQKHDVNVILTFPFNVAALTKRLLMERYDLTNLTTLITGGSSLSETTRINLSETLPSVEIIVEYGMTEVGIISCSNVKTKFGSVGYLVAGMNAKVRNMNISLQIN